MCIKIIKAHAPVSSAITLLTDSTKQNFNCNQVRYICSLDQVINNNNIQGSLFSAHEKLVLELQELELPHILLKISVNKENRLPSLHTDFMKDNFLILEMERYLYQVMRKLICPIL